MTLAGLSARVNRVIAWADGLQRRHGVLGFPYAVTRFTRALNPANVMGLACPAPSGYGITPGPG